MTSNLAAVNSSSINNMNNSNELNPETHRLIKNILGINTDLSINEILDLLGQVYIVKFSL